jgi:hypothetical protein
MVKKGFRACGAGDRLPPGRSFPKLHPINQRPSTCLLCFADEGVPPFILGRTLGTRGHLVYFDADHPSIYVLPYTQLPQTPNFGFAPAFSRLSKFSINSDGSGSR